MQTLIIFSTLLSATFAQFPGCGTQSNTFCVTERQYISCDQTTWAKEPTIYFCPLEGQFCADTPYTCTTNTSIPKSGGSYCDLCSTQSGSGYACTSPTHFERCTNGAITNRTGLNECPAGTICNAHSPNAGNPCTGFSGKEMVCWKEPITEPVTDEEKCAAEKLESIPVPNSLCKQFLVCQLNADGKTYTAAKLMCKAGYNYSPELRICVPEFIYPCPK